MRIKLLLVLGISFLTLGFSPSTSIIDSTTVYVCGKSTIFHTARTHGALKRCKSSIYEMTRNKATQQGKRACKCKG
jgi:hypothetical protein